MGVYLLSPDKPPREHMCPWRNSGIPRRLKDVEDVKAVKLPQNMAPQHVERLSWTARSRKVTPTTTFTFFPEIRGYPSPPSPGTRGQRASSSPEMGNTGPKGQKAEQYITK